MILLQYLFYNQTHLKYKFDSLKFKLHNFSPSQTHPAYCQIFCIDNMQIDPKISSELNKFTENMKIYGLESLGR